MSIADNVARVRERIAAACARAGRSPNDVRLMAVSKTHPASAICEAFAAGITLFGENRVQEFAEKHLQLAGTDAEFHLIGHLQSNKAAKAAELFGAVDSVDSLRLAERLNAAAEKLSKNLAVLLEVNVGAEEAKSGFAPDSNELGALLAKASDFPHLQIRGLMTIPPHTEDSNGARPHFRMLRELRDKLTNQIPSVQLPELSMGMSHDYEVAIEEGSTCVRVGTAIFGERPKR
jgi:pyridoxal phosphate enzyme (YggS family)